MESISKAYLPAAGHDRALPLYDSLVKLLGGDKARKVLLDQAAGQSIRRVLEVGCGTGTLALMIKSLDPEAEVVGLDPVMSENSIALKTQVLEGLLEKTLGQRYYQFSSGVTLRYAGSGQDNNRRDFKQIGFLDITPEL